MGAAAYGARAAVGAWHAWKAAGPRMRAFYKGGFQVGLVWMGWEWHVPVRDGATGQLLRRSG